MSKPSKPGLSFGLSLKKAPSKPAPAKRKPATFGDDDDDDDTPTPSAFAAAPKGKPPQSTSGLAPPPAQEVVLTELDALSTTAPAAPAPAPSSPPRKPKSKLAAGSTTSPPGPPPKLSSPPAAADPSQTPFGDLASALTSRQHAAAAAAVDPTVYDYDGVYDSLKAAARRRKEAAEAAEEADKARGPRYMAAVLGAAAVRERDRLVAEERRLAREREAEGDAFADKERFVTGAYRRQQEEARRAEEEERAREEAERRRNKGRGMAGWYREMLERGEREHGEVLRAVEEGKGKVQGGGDEKEEEAEGERPKTEEELAKEMLQKGKKVTVNEDGQIVDKRELLQGGLNVGAKKKAEALREKSRLAQGGREDQRPGGAAGGVYVGGKQAMRERQTRMLEAQLEESLKRAREEEEQERKKVELVAKSRKTEADISSARERYLARKRAAEEAKKNGAADGP